MIDEQATLQRFGYSLLDLAPCSRKKIVTICESCGTARIACFKTAGKYCRTCGPKQPERRQLNSAGVRRSWQAERKGWKHSEETKQKVSIAKKGTPAWNKGLKGIFRPSSEHVQKMLDGLRIKGRDEQHRQRISQSLRGNTNSKGKKWIMSERGRINVRMSNGHRGKPAWNRGKSNHWCKGEKNRFWNGGVSKYGYPCEFNAKLKLRIRTRDSFTCQLCGKTEEQEKTERGRVLSVNHIDFNKLNCAENNLNTLCHRCNTTINSDREKWTAYFRKQLCFANVA